MSSKQLRSRFSRAGYIFSMMGSAIGFANILSFSARCYKNGGGAFLIPFILAVAVVGLPMLFLEGIIGQAFQRPLVSAYGYVSGRKGRFFGWLAVISCATIGAFYAVLTGWSIAYTGFSAMGMIPEDVVNFFEKTFLQDSGSIENMGSFSPLIFFSTVAIMLFTWFVLVRDIQEGIEKVCSFFLPLLAMLIGLFTLVVFFLPGSLDGFIYFLKPDFSKLWDFSLWREVFGHVFFSFSLGLGIVVGYSRYTDQTMNIPRAMLYVALGDFFISFIAGFAIFGCVGFLSFMNNVSFESIIRSDSTFEMGFVIFPMILQCFTPAVAILIGALFFFSVFIAGITGVFSIVESVAGNVQEEFSLTRERSVTFSILGMIALSFFFCMGNGIHLLAALEPMVIGNNMLIGGIAEVFIFMYVAKEIRDHHIWFQGEKRMYAFYMIRYFILPILSIIFIGALVTELRSGFAVPEMFRWGWFFFACVLSLLLSRERNSICPPMEASAAKKK